MLFGDHMCMDPAYREALRACGLDSVERVLRRLSGEVAAWSRSTDTLFVAGPAGGVGFYVKRYRYPRWAGRLRGGFRGTFFGAHRGQAEWRLLRAMQRLGILAVRPVAYGVRRVARFVCASFLITEEVPGATNLTAFALDVRDGRRTLLPVVRRRLVCGLARHVADAHAAGFAHGQLFWRNFVVRFGPTGEPEFFLLDARPRRGARRLRRGARWTTDELGQVSASALPFTTRSERLRFLMAYFGASRLSPEIRRAWHEIEHGAARWEAHERRRILMSERFQAWRRQLGAESRRSGVALGDELAPFVNDGDGVHPPGSSQGARAEPYR